LTSGEDVLQGNTVEVIAGWEAASLAITLALAKLLTKGITTIHT
jgi:hypothetical protein